MAEPAKLRASNLKFSRLNRREMHVNGQAGYGVLFEPHRRNEEAVDDVVSPKDYLDLTVDWHDHNSTNHIVLGGWIFCIQAERGFPASRSIFQLRLGQPEFSSRPRITEIPGELHAGDFDADPVCFCRTEPFGSPNRAAHQVHADEEHRR